MVLDYSTTCGACSTPLTSPPRDGAGAMCAYLHTSVGRSDFAAILASNLKRQAVIDATPTVAHATLEPSPTPDATPIQPNDATDATPQLETRSQRHRRLKKERDGALST